MTSIVSTRKQLRSRTNVLQDDGGPRYLETDQGLHLPKTKMGKGSPGQDGGQKESSWVPLLNVYSRLRRTQTVRANGIYLCDPV